MPHQCTNCGHRFEDGSKEMLSGCPSCDGNKFQFIPAGRDAPPAGSTGTEGSTTSPAASQPASPATGDASAPETGGSAGDARSADDPRPTGDAGSAGDGTQVASDATAEATPEDDAQTSARSSFVSSEELEKARRKMADAQEQRLAEVDGDSADAGDEGANLQALREELNDQFESIKIKAPGQYELNLMELYDREEYIISLREDGKYVIEMPESWRDDE